MKRILLFISFIPFISSAQFLEQTVSQTVDNHYFLLENNRYYQTFKIVTIGQTDTFRIEKLHDVISSTGNPYEKINFQFIDSQVGFIYGHEQGYGVWPFLFKTIDGGKNWVRKVYEQREYGSQLEKDNFYMFDKLHGILIDNTNNIRRALNGKINSTRFRYYITNDGGETWKRKSLKLKHAKSLRIENGEHFMQCHYSMDGKIIVNILTPPWETTKGKRELKDRIRLTLHSNNFGKSFNEELLQ